MRISHPSRRDLLKLGALGLGSVVLPLARLRLSQADDSFSSPSITPFQMPLPVPVTANPIGTTRLARTPSGRLDVEADVFALEARVGLAQMLPPPFGPTRIWGYYDLSNGQPRSPTFLVRRDRPALVALTNPLTEAATGAHELGLSTHLHGGNVDGFSDGHPLDLVPPPGSSNISKPYTYFNEQPAVTMWYHDHSDHHTSRNVYKGLAGFYLVSDPHEDSLKLPGSPLADGPGRGYGVFDVPLLIQDKIFSQDGSELIFPPGDHPDEAPGSGTLGDTIVVNGAAWPFLEVQRRKYRFRFLNGSVAREYLLALSSGQPFMQIGTEGGLLPRQVPQQTIRISQAERYEVIIDFTNIPDGTNVVLQNRFEEGKLGLVMQFKVRGGTPAADPSFVPDQLMSTDPEARLGGKSLQQRFDELRALGTRLLQAERSETARPPEISRFREFEFNRSGGQFTINGNPFRGTLDPATNVDDADPKEGTIEVWTFKNSSGGWFHPVHTHLLHAGFGYLMLDRNEVPITATSQEWGWKETANVGFGNTIRVLMHWPQVPVNPNLPEHPFFSRRYVFHCHNTDHEDADMMAQVRVDRSQPAPAPAGFR